MSATGWRAGRSDALRERAWARGGALRWALAPAAALYRTGLAMRRAGYAIGLARARRVPVPVVSVGNLTVGGTGKTPAALWLAERLREVGAAPAIVSRGYGGALRGRVLVAAASAAAGEGTLAEVGDEAVLLASRFPGPVVCGVDRVAAARLAIERCRAGAIVLDDGFQHWRLARDCDVVLVDGRSGFGNRALLPAGPLREPLGALRRAHAIVVTKCAARPELLADLRRHAPQAPVFTAELVARALVRFENGALVAQPLGELVGRRIVTVSGVAQPQSFYELLGQLEVRPIEVLEFPDHHPYSQADWQRISKAAHAADLVVCTEKDLVKLRHYPFARNRLSAVRVDFALAAGDEERLVRLVLERMGFGSRLRPQGVHAS